jgi:hypothetical protein
VLGDSLVRSAQPQMSARRAEPRNSNCCDSVEACSISIHPCQREIERCDSTADFSGRRSFAVGRGHHLRFGFAIGRPDGIASRPIECRPPRRVSTSDTKRARRLDAALVLASRAPLLAAQGMLLPAQPRCAVETLHASETLHAAEARAADALLRAEGATEYCSIRRVRIIFFEAIYFRFGASGRLSTAMINRNKPLIGSNDIQSRGGHDWASDCADVSARCDVSTPSSSRPSRDDRRLERQTASRSGAPAGLRLAERAA